MFNYRQQLSLFYIKKYTAKNVAVELSQNFTNHKCMEIDKIAEKHY